jgi:uncharacterized repeat protein (TIGR01451 family)
MNFTTRCLTVVCTLALIPAAFALAPATAAPKAGCIELKAVAEMEQTVKAADGSQSRQLVAVAKTVPGDEIVWTTTAHNLCDKPADKVVIDLPVPEHMNFVADSAQGKGAQISYSVDGKEFKAATELTVRASDGTRRAARAEEVRHVRWILVSAIAPKDTALVRFRATVQ